MLKMTMDEVRAAETIELPESAPILVDQRMIDAFAAVAEDHQWIHQDIPAAWESQFGAPIAHGYLVLSLFSPLFDRTFAITDQEVIVNYGVDRWRFTAPVRSGSSLVLRGKIAVAEAKDGMTRLKISVEMHTRPDGELAAVGDVIFLVR